MRMQALARHWHWPALVALVAAFFADPLLTGRVFFYRDLGMLMHPVLSAALHPAGEWTPVVPWMHLLSNGRPFLANPGYASLAPLAALHALPFDFAFDAFLVSHVLIGGLGMAFLARRLGCGQPAAFAAGAAHALGAAMISSIPLYWSVVSAGWAPWTLAAALAMGRRPTARTVALLAVALGLQGLGGQAEQVAATVAAAMLVSAGACLGSDARDGARSAPSAGRRLARVAGAWLPAGIGGLALAAPQLLPAALHARTTLRSLRFTADGILYNSLDPRALPGLAIPRWGGHPMRLLEGGFPGAAWTDAGTPYLVTHYVGAAAAVLAILGASRLLRSRGTRPLGVALVACALLGIVLALGRHVPGMASAVESLPFAVPFRFPVKALLMTFLAVPPLAALGIEAVASSRRTRWAPLLAVLVAGDLALAHRGFAPTAPRSAFEEPPLSRELKARAARFGVHRLQWRLYHERVADGGWHDESDHAFRTEQELYQWRRRLLMPPSGAAFGLHHAMQPTSDLLDDLRYFELIRRAHLAPRAEWARILGLAGVLFVVSPRGDLEAETGGALVHEMRLGREQGVPDGSGHVYRNVSFVPRASLADGGRVASLEESPSGLRLGCVAAVPAALRISDVLGDLEEWSAEIDGRPAVLRRWEGAFVALDVPEGSHVVELRCRPKGLVAGCWAFAGALAAVIAALARGRARPS